MAKSIYKFIYIFLLGIILNLYLVIAIDCNVYSCDQEDYLRFDASNPTFKPYGDASNGNSACDYGYGVESGKTCGIYSNYVANSSTLSIKFDSQRMDWTMNGTEQIACLDYYTELCPTSGTGHAIGVPGSFNWGIRPDPVDCGNSHFCIYSGSYQDTGITCQNSTWHTICLVSNLTAGNFYYRVDNINITHVTSVTDPFNSGDRWRIENYDASDFYMDNFRTWHSDNNTLSLDGIITCIQNLTNTSWSSWENVSSCYENNTVTKRKNLTQYDLNGCSENSTFYNYSSDSCIYIPTPSNGFIVSNPNGTEWFSINATGQVNVKLLENCTFLNTDLDGNLNCSSTQLSSFDKDKGDSLGNHTATETLDLNTYGIENWNGVMYFGAGTSSVDIGAASNTVNNANAIGIGNDVDASAQKTVAIGYDSHATSAEAVALGIEVESTSGGAISLGNTLITSGSYGITIGYGGNSIATEGVYIGKSGGAAATHCIALGSWAQCEGTQSVAIGPWSRSTTSNATGSTNVGYYAESTQYHGLALGTYALAEGKSCSVIGSYSNCSGTDSITLGSNATTTHPNSVAIGTGSRALAEGAVSIGPNVVNDIPNSVKIGNGTIYMKYAEGIVNATEYCFQNGECTQSWSAINESGGISDINGTDINITKAIVDDLTIDGTNITHNSNKSFGIYQDGNCIVIGNLNYANDCCDGDC